MDTLLREAVPSLCSNELSSLVGKAAWPCISIYMPVADSIDPRHENVVRLHGLLKDAATRLISRRVDVAIVEMLLNPLYALAGDEPFWRQRSEGLALFTAPGVLGHCRVPAANREKVVVGQEFYITALLPLLSAEQEYFILVLSLEAVKLLRIRRQRASEVELPAQIPTSLTAALQYDEFGQVKELYSGTPGWSTGRPGAVFFGRGAGSDEKKPEILRFFQQIDGSLRQILAGGHAPLVLAGLEYLVPIYRAANSYPHLAEEAVLGHPDRMNSVELRDAAWPIVWPLFERAERQAVARYRDLAGTGLTSDDLAAVLPAAHAGRIDTLLLRNAAERWGTFDSRSAALEVHQQEQPGDEELLNMAACRTIAHGGSVYAVERAELPAGSVVGALLRY